MSLNCFRLEHLSGIMAINKNCVVINILSIQNREINKWKNLSFFFLFKDLALYNKEFKNSKKKKKNHTHKKKTYIFSPSIYFYLGSNMFLMYVLFFCCC